MEMVEMVVLRREDIPLTYSPSFHFFYFSLFLLPFSLPFSFLFLFCFAFVTYFKISKEFTQNKHMEELFCGGLKRVCQNVKCNV